MEEAIEDIGKTILCMEKVNMNGMTDVVIKVSIIVTANMDGEYFTGRMDADMKDRG